MSIFTGRRRDIEWREVSGKGVVFSYTITHRGTPAFRGAEPYAVVSVTLDVGVNFIADIVNCTAEELKVGMKVKPYWHPLEDGTHLSCVPARQMSGPHDARGPRRSPIPAPALGGDRRNLPRAGSAGQVILQALKLNKFKGDIHLVGRTASRSTAGRAQERGRAARASTSPSSRCRPRRARGDRGLRAPQGRLGDDIRRRLCRGRRSGDTGRDHRHRAAAGLAVVGPNCLGITNNVDGMWLHMLYARARRKRGVGVRHRLRRPERRLAWPLPARRRWTRPAAELRDLDRHQRPGSKAPISRIPRRRPGHPRDRDLLRGNPPAAHSSPPAAALARPASRSC